jgi:hypothetical protein
VRKVLCLSHPGTHLCGGLSAAPTFVGFLLATMGFEPRILHMLSKHCTAKLHPQPLILFWFFFSVLLRQGLAL